MGRVDDHDELSIETYKLVKAWILQREIKLKLRKNTRSGKGKSPMTWSTASRQLLPRKLSPASRPQPRAPTHGFQRRPTRGQCPRAYPRRQQLQQRQLGRTHPRLGCLSPNGRRQVEISMPSARARARARTSPGLLSSATRALERATRRGFAQPRQGLRASQAPRLVATARARAIMPSSARAKEEASTSSHPV